VGHWKFSRNKTSITNKNKTNKINNINKTNKNKTNKNKSKQKKKKQTKTKQTKTKQNKTKQNKTKQNKTQHNKTKHKTNTSRGVSERSLLPSISLNYPTVSSTTCAWQRNHARCPCSCAARLICGEHAQRDVRRRTFGQHT
jgi:hypothetical protein